VNTRRFPDVFRRRYEYHHPIPLDCAAMREGLRHLVGEHDFTSFASTHSAAPHHVRTIFSARLIVEPEGGPDGAASGHVRDGSAAGLDAGVRNGAAGGSDDGARGVATGSASRESAPEKVRGRIHLELTGNGFLYNMVRIIAGTLLEVG